MFSGFTKSLVVGAVLMFAANPTSTNFTLKSYDFGNGGDATSSTNFRLDSTTGIQAENGLSSTNFKVLSGMLPTQQANVPDAATFTNPSNEYNRLQLIVNTANNPSDTKYQIAISDDNFVTTNYIQTDNTVGSTNTIAQYQTYTSWGGASGFWVVGLKVNTTYKVKVRALQGGFTGTAFGPESSAATVLPTLTFSVATSLTSTPPYTIGFSNLSAGAVVSATTTADIGLTTNSLNGGIVYVKSNSTLASALAGSSIPSVTADLTSAGSGYGAIVTSVSQASGGPFSAVAPYNGIVNNVGSLTTALQPIVTTNGALTAGTASITLKAKVTATTPAATDYTDTLTFVAAMRY